MNVIICGAGQVGIHTAEVLTEAGHNITLVDRDEDHLRRIGEVLDVRTLLGNCANADVLREAGVHGPNSALVAATGSDEINLLTAAVAKGIGIGRCVARVHHSAYFDQRGLDYSKHLGIDQLICPEHATAQAIASSLRDPATLVIENFGSGQIEVQPFTITPDAPALDKALVELAMPQGVRVAAIRRGETVFLPVASTRIEMGDVVILVGNIEVFQDGRALFQKSDPSRRSLVIMGGTTMGVWLARALQDRAFSIRLFEPNRTRAEELAEKLDWVTIINSDPTDAAVFDEEHIAQADAFVALSSDDEHNLLACALAKTSGVAHVIAVVQQPRYASLIDRVSMIDRGFSPRTVAARMIEQSLSPSDLMLTATLAKGFVDVYRVRVPPTSEVVGQTLRQNCLSPDWMVAAIQHGQNVRVPTADDIIHASDTVLVIGRHGQDQKLRRIFDL